MMYWNACAASARKILNIVVWCAVQENSHASAVQPLRRAAMHETDLAHGRVSD
jgi:hypothetical protein